MCAGDPPRGGIDEFNAEVWNEAWGVKLLGTALMIHAMLPTMVKQDYGRIVVVAGVNGRNPTPDRAIGGATNAALANLTKGVARQVMATGVTVNTVDPHFTRTGRWERLVSEQMSRGGTRRQAINAVLGSNPGFRPLDPQEVAEVVVFLDLARIHRFAAQLTG